MPYSIRRRDDEYCLYKVNGSGRLGSRVGCHQSRSDAVDQQQAIAASESESKSVSSKCHGLFSSPLIAALMGKRHGCYEYGKNTLAVPHTRGKG